VSAGTRAWQRAGRPDEGQRGAPRRDLAEGRSSRAAEALEELGDLAGAADAWARAEAAGQQPLASRPLPLPAAAQRTWSDGGKPARLARAIVGTRAEEPSARPDSGGEGAWARVRRAGRGRQGTIR